MLLVVVCQVQESQARTIRPLLMIFKHTLRGFSIIFTSSRNGAIFNKPWFIVLRPTIRRLDISFIDRIPIELIATTCATDHDPVRHFCSWGKIYETLNLPVDEILCPQNRLMKDCNIHWRDPLWIDCSYLCRWHKTRQLLLWKCQKNFVSSGMTFRRISRVHLET